MKRWLALIGGVVGCSLFAAAGGEAFKGGFPRERLWEMLSNRDVAWAGEYPGLRPHLSPNAETILQARDPAAGRILRAWLADADRFAIAHVLLTMAEGARHPVSASEWNGLRVEISAAGEVRYDPAQMSALRQKWGPAASAGAK